MKALILNSGVGLRMGTFTQSAPKCMTPIGGGYTIISRQLLQLFKAGIREVVITTGPFAELLKEHIDGLGLPMNITYIANPIFQETNYIYSMHLAAAQLDDDILLLHGDLVLENSVLNDLLSSSVSVAAVDSTLPLPEKDFKARLENGRIIAIGIEFFGPDCVASQPAYVFKQADFAAWMKVIHDFCENGQRRVYAENAFNAKNGDIPLYPLELNGRLCNEIDNPQDLIIVSERFLTILEKEEARS